MKKILFVFLYILFCSLSAQTYKNGNERFHSGPKPIYLEAHVFPGDSLNTCYISYRVPYSNIVFIKNGLTFSGGITLRIEATGQEGVIARESTHDELKVNTYEETKLDYKYLQGVLSFKMSSSSVTINPLIELENTDRQFPLRPFKVEVDDYEPMVVSESSKCPDSHGYSIINFENTIPFDDVNHQVMIPIYDSKINQIKVRITQNEKDIAEKKLNKVSTLSLGLAKCKDDIFLVNNTNNSAANIFFLNNFSTLLEEGPFQLSIFNNSDSLIYEAELAVNWIDKPLPLMEPKFAFSLLELMEKEDKLDDIYDIADGDYEKAILLFWKDYDPDKNTKFNQLMYEFYSRAEKALTEYSLKGERFGTLTDRAKVFIKYGEPSEVDRYYSDKNQITEIWKYLSPKVEFVFVDASGLGNYKLVN